MALIRQAEKLCECRIYIDFAFRPPLRECHDLRKANVTEVFGWSSFHELPDFDVICCSFSVHFESPSILASFWGGKICPFFYERGENDPFILSGGIMGQYLETMFGHPRGAITDLLFLGEGEDRLTNVIHELYKERAVLRSDRLGVIQRMVSKFDNLYFPNGYEHTYDGTKLTSITRKYPWVPEKVKYYRSFNPTPPIFENRILITGNEHAGRAALRVSQGCSGAGCCSFCTEGSEAGPWREHPASHVISKFNTLIESCAPNLISYYAYNLNFHSDYLKLIQEASNRFSTHSVIAFRADVAAETEGYVRLLKQTGASRITIALEGVSERIRRILNKNVTWDHFHNVAEQVFKEGIGVLKVNLITTGLETHEDYDEMFLHIDAFLSRAKELGSKAKLSLSTSILVTYWNTALQWTPRHAIVDAMKVYHVFRLFDRCKERGITLKLHSGHECILQQLLVDGGRSISEPVFDWYWKVWQGNKAIYYPIQDLNDLIFAHLGVEDRNQYFLQERKFDDLNPTSSYDIIPEVIQRMWYTRNNNPTSYCLRTVANQSPRCLGCNLCPPDHKPFILQRPIQSSIPEIPKSQPPISSLHVIYNVNSDPLARCKHKLVLCHYMASKVIKELGLTQYFHSVVNYSDYAISTNRQVDIWGGVGSFDINLRCSSDFLRALPINPLIFDFKVAKLLSIGINNSKAPSSEFGGVWRFKSELPRDRLFERLQKYDGKVVIRDQLESTSLVVGSIDVPLQDTGLCVQQEESGSLGYLYLGHRVNPLFALSSMFKWPLLRVRSEFIVSRLLLFEGKSGQQCSCGNPTLIDSQTREPFKVCGVCASKLCYSKNL